MSNIYILNELVKRLADAEGNSQIHTGAKTYIWTNGETNVEIETNAGHGSRDEGENEDDSPPTKTFRVQRLPKCEGAERRDYLVRQKKEGGTSCACHLDGQLPYSTCLNFVHEKQTDRTWISENGAKNASGEKMQTFAEFVRHVCAKLLPCPFIDTETADLTKDWIVNDVGQHTPNGDDSENDDCRLHPNILRPWCIFETRHYFYAVTPASKISDHVTLWDAAVMHPHVLAEHTDRLLFVAYQIASILACCHRIVDFLPVDLRLDVFRLNAENYWCQFDVWRCMQYAAERIDPKEDGYSTLGAWTDRWTRGSISNYDYLLTLNEFAGRRFGDPYYHPIFPWVCDFTTSDDDGGWRDLSKTKYRLTKGDQQLEQTYGHVGLDGGGSRAALPPHHVTEFLSDIGYYAYKARRTPKSLLRLHVRRRWVPEEYPSSVRRLYEWTPDEAIPEFYSDPSIFRSIHDDLPDLDVPDWCSSSVSKMSSEEKFIEWHRRRLESDRVSENLHSWIDLIFGYQLTGQAAIKAKNVQMRMAEREDRLTNNGVVQLFTKPHPKKLNNRKNPGAFSPSALNEVMNPLYDLERMDLDQITPQISRSDNRFSQDLAPALPAEVWRKIQACQAAQKTCQLIEECLINFGVLLTELCLSGAFRHLPKGASNLQRLQAARQAVFNGHSSPLPRCLRRSVETLLNLNQRDQSANDFLGANLLCPGMILQPIINLIPFPHYLAPMYDCFRRVHLSEMAFNDRLKNAPSASVNALVISAEQRVRDAAKLLPLILPHMSAAGVDLLTRLAKRTLFANVWTRVLTAWSLFNPLAQALGPAQCEKHLLDCLVDLYDAEAACSSKFLKLYHRTFLLQLSVRLGMKRFLTHFVQLLIEAAAGERDRQLFDDDETYWSFLLGEGSETDAPFVNRRPLSAFCSSFIKESPGEDGKRMDVSPLVARKNLCAQSPDNVDSSSVQFQMDFGEEAQNRNAFLSTKEFDAASIRSSESGGCLQSKSDEYQEEEDEISVDQIRVESMANENKVRQQNSTSTVSEVAEESLLWLAHRLGPLLTARYVTKNLLRMLALCYSTDRLTPCGTSSSRNSDTDSNGSAWYPVTGDIGADKLLRCLEEIASIYGEQMILRHYYVYAGELIAQAVKRLTPNMEMSLLACVTLFRRTFAFLTHEQLMENLRGHTFIDALLFPLVRTASSIKVTFSTIAARTTLAWKIVETLYWLGVRIGGENVKNYLLVLVQRLFCTYDLLYKLDEKNTSMVVEETRCPIVDDNDETTYAAAFVQLKATFTPALASKMLQAFPALCGRQYLQLSTANIDLLTKLCETRTGENENDPNANAVIFRRSDDGGAVDAVCKRLKHSGRKLKGNWLAYWEYELGRDPKEAHFYFKHMKLQSFIGHTSSVRKICVLNNENSFMSASHDKTVKLWSIRSTGDGASRLGCQHTYKSHKKPLWDLAFVESVRLVASVDGVVHIWDPFMGVPIRQFDFADCNDSQQQNHMATIVEANLEPSNMLLVAGTLPVIRCLDVRQAKWAHEFSIAAQRQQNAGPVRAMCSDPSGNSRWVAVGHGAGQVSTLDLRVGRLLGQTKLCDTDIFAMSSYEKDQFVVCPFDQALCLVRADDCGVQCRIPGTSDAIVCMAPFHRELIAATQSNRLRMYTDVSAEASFTDSRLRADVFSGAATAITVLPLNKLLLMGSTTGAIELLC